MVSPAAAGQSEPGDVLLGEDSAKACLMHYIGESRHGSMGGLRKY